MEGDVDRMKFSFDQAIAYFKYRLVDAKVPARGAFTARCPFHGDRTASLSVNLDKGVWNCHACNIGGGIFDFESQMFSTRTIEERWEAIYKITGATPPAKNGKFVAKGPVVATYQYTDVSGKLLFEKRRHEPKCFTQRAPWPNGGWKYSLDGVKRVLYRLPELITAPMAFIVEGEKDADNIAALNLEWSGHKVAATCNFDGAGKWSDKYSPFFTGKFVAIFPDNDEPGRAHAQTVAASVFKFAEAVKVINLSGLPEKGDVSDWLKSHTGEELLQAVKDAAGYQVEDVKAAEATPFFVSASKLLPDGAPTMRWFIPGAIHRGAKGLFVAQPKAGKSLLALDLAVALSSGLPWLGMQPPTSAKVGVVSREDGPAMTQDRLKKFAAGRSLDFKALPGLYINTHAQRRTFSIESDADVEDISGWITKEGIELCIFDVLNKLHAADENDNSKMTAVMARFDTIRMATGCDCAVIHHDTKNSAPGAKKPRGASAIDSWWDWKVSINVDPDNDALKRVFFATKAGTSLSPLVAQFSSHETKGLRIDVVKS
jgi:AAA domain/CHC2 zinc finger